MINLVVDLLDKSTINTACADLSSDELQKIRATLLELIDERKKTQEQKLLERKGDRLMSDMRKLMAKAGISMEELQAALPD